MNGGNYYIQHHYSDYCDLWSYFINDNYYSEI